MMRRYFAVAFTIFFFAYAGYLIITDGGKQNTIISFKKINENIHKKFQILIGNQKPDLTPEEKAQLAILEAQKKTEREGGDSPPGSSSTDSSKWI